MEDQQQNGGKPNGDHYHFFFKIAIVGDSGVGKSCLLNAESKMDPEITDDDDVQWRSPMHETKQYKDVDTHIPKELQAEQSASIQFKTRNYKYRDAVYKVQYWDCPGSERYQSLTSMYSSGACGIVFVFDLTNMRSFERVKVWMDQLHDANKNAVKVLVGNKDNCLSTPRQVPRSLAEGFSRQHNMSYFETDALSFIRCDAVFRELFLQIVQTIPSPAEPRMLLNRGIKIGPALLADQKYRHSLQELAQRSSRLAQEPGSFAMDWL